MRIAQQGVCEFSQTPCLHENDHGVKMFIVGLLPDCENGVL